MTYTRVFQQMIKKPSQTVLFTPGMLCDQRLWEPTFQRMMNIRKQFIDFNKCMDVAACSQKIEQQQEAAFSLVGFSMGGYVAIEHLLMAKRKPSSLVLISSSARGYTATEVAQRQHMMQLAGKSFSQIINPSRLMKWIDNENPERNAITALLVRMAETAGLDAFIQQQTATLHRLDRRELLKNISDIPVLIIHGANDKLIPVSHAEELASIIPGATCKIIENCGHMIPLEKPDQLANILSDWFNTNKLISNTKNEMTMQTNKTEDVYTLKRGKAGEERLNVLNDIYNSDSEDFLLKQDIMQAKNVLDLGCGTGQMACWIAKSNPNCHVTCVDISADQLAVAKERAALAGLTNLSFKQCSAYELEELNEKFDFIYTRFVLAHIQQPLKALKSIYSVLTPNGKLACEEAKTSEHYCHPEDPAFTRYYEIWSNIRLLKGADPELGSKLGSLYNEAGFNEVTSQLVTRDLPLGDRTRLIFGFNLNEIGDEAIHLGLTTAEELESLKISIHQLINRHDVTLRFSGSMQVAGRKMELHNELESSAVSPKNGA